jgi:beta-phosphoglucomutase-like phosphatase (HAD superfamily)
VLGLPDGIRGCLFDLDGVLTQTAKAHDAAWQEMSDDYLQDVVVTDPAELLDRR